MKRIQIITRYDILDPLISVYFMLQYKTTTLFQDLIFAFTKLVKNSQWVI